MTHMRIPSRKIARALFVYAACMHGYKDWMLLQYALYRVVYGVVVMLTFLTYCQAWEYCGLYLALWHVGQDLPALVVLNSAMGDSYLALWMYFVLVHIRDDDYSLVTVWWTAASIVVAAASFRLPNDETLLRGLMAVTIPHVLFAALESELK